MLSLTSIIIGIIGIMSWVSKNCISATGARSEVEPRGQEYIVGANLTRYDE